jgi:hypothetical protein
MTAVAINPIPTRVTPTLGATLREVHSRWIDILSRNGVCGDPGAIQVVYQSFSVGVTPVV